MEQDPITRITSNSNHEIIPRQSDRSQEPRSIDVTICVAHCNLWAGHRLSDRQQWWYQMWLTLLAVTQSQSRYVARYHHHCASIIRVSAYIPLEFWNKLHAINLFRMIAGYKKKKKEEEGGEGRKKKIWKMTCLWQKKVSKYFDNISDWFSIFDSLKEETDTFLIHVDRNCSIIRQTWRNRVFRWKRFMEN